MTRFLKPVIVVAATTFGVVGPETLETHAVSIPTVVGVVMTVSSFAWWLSHKFTVIDDKFTALQNQINNLPCPKVVPKIAEVLKIDPACEPEKEKPKG